MERACVDRIAPATASSSPDPRSPNAASATTSFEYPSLSSRSRLNLFCVYTSRVLIRTSFFFHPTADGMSPHSSRNSPSHRSMSSPGAHSASSPSHSAFARSTTFALRSGCISTSHDTSQRTSAVVDAASDGPSEPSDASPGSATRTARSRCDASSSSPRNAHASSRTYRRWSAGAILGS
eukprot:30948-Pelagococcus_subviridis.AAC.9